MLKYAIADGNTFKTTVRFGTEFDATGRALAVGYHFTFFGLISAVKEGATVKAAYLTVGDGHILCAAKIPQRERTFKADAGIPGTVHRTIGYVYIVAAVYI